MAILSMQITDSQVCVQGSLVKVQWNIKESYFYNLQTYNSSPANHTPLPGEVTWTLGNLLTPKIHVQSENMFI